MSLDLILGAVLIVALAVAGWLYYKNVNKKEEAAEPEPVAVDPVVEGEKTLKELNLSIRKAALPQKAMHETEMVIDQLLELNPLVQAKATGATECRWTVGQMIKDYLPNRTVKPYMNLSSELRESGEHLDTYLEMLKTLSGSLADIKSALDSKDEQQLALKSKFIQERFK